jgi:hypothetical protein
MTTLLKTILDTWDADLRSAKEMTVHLSQLGLPDEHLPSSHALRAACLALQASESLDRLRHALMPREQELVDQGVLHVSQKVRDMRGGAMVVLNHAIDKLHIFTEQIDSMLERAYSFTQPDLEFPGHPTIKIGTDRVEGHKYQLANLQIKLKDVVRLLIYAEFHDAPRILIFPPETIRITVPILEGELLLYAENMLGAAAKRLQFSEVKYG